MSGPFRLIYIDPPWWYAPRKRGKFGKGARGHYPLMKDKELLAFRSKIDALAADSCLMAMWATGARLDFAVELGKAWGFRYCTMGWVWVKTSADGVIRKLPGTYTSQSAEFLLLFARGPIPRPAEAMTLNVVPLPTAEHSRKPAFFRRELARLWPGLVPRVEVFAREHRPGWFVYGNETEKFVASG